MNLSRRHHYIPQFLIRHFADENGMLWIYDKQYKQLSKEKKGTKSVFFEMNRNIVNFHGIQTDRLERFYSHFDNNFAKLLNEIFKNKLLTVEYIGEILIFINMLKWRIPINDTEFNTLKNDLTYEKLPIRIKIEGLEKEVETSALNHLINSEPFKITKRIIFPVLPFYQGNNLNEAQLLDIVNKCYININEEVHSVLGDVAFIEKDKLDVDLFNNIIFPLSNSCTFIYSHKGPNQISSIDFYFSKDLAVFHRSKRYVVCKNRDYFESLIRTYEQIVKAKQLNIIDKYVFDFI